MYRSTTLRDIVLTMDTETKDNTFGDRLRTLRSEVGLTQGDISEHLARHGIDVKQAAVSHYEIGRSEPNIATLNALAQLFEVSIDYLLGYTDNPQTIAEMEAALADNRGEGEIAKLVGQLSKARRQQAIDYLDYLLSLEQAQISAQNLEGFRAAITVLERRLGAPVVQSALAAAAAEFPWFRIALANSLEEERVKKSN